eukprot:1925736-Pyramimonas_sp.AAC.1
MTLGHSYGSHISPSSDRARCYRRPCSQALIPALKQMTFVSSFASRTSLSSDRTQCHCPRFSNVVITELQLMSS